MFFIKSCVGGRRCHECGDSALFHRNFPIDQTHPRLSYITVKWNRYVYVSMNPSYSSHVPSKRINLLEDDIPISKFMDKFQSQIYKYIKHSHRSRWQYLEFKHSREFFESGTILSVVEFAKNYTFSLQREIQSEYYHFDQVSIFIHVLYTHAQTSIDGRDNTPQSCHVIKEYHIYVSYDYENDTLFVQHCFGLIYDSFKKMGCHL